MLADVLPADIWITVLHYLDVAELGSLAQTSRYFHALVYFQSHRVKREMMYEHYSR